MGSLATVGSIMTYYKSDILKQLSCSQAGMGKVYHFTKQMSVYTKGYYKTGSGMLRKIFVSKWSFFAVLALCFCCVFNTASQLFWTQGCRVQFIYKNKTSMNNTCCSAQSNLKYRKGWQRTNWQ